MPSCSLSFAVPRPSRQALPDIAGMTSAAGDAALLPPLPAAGIIQRYARERYRDGRISGDIPPWYSGPDMSNPFFQIWNTHTASCGEAPTITNQSDNKYYGYFQNRFGEQWVFVYDHEKKTGELR